MKKFVSHLILLLSLTYSFGSFGQGAGSHARNNSFGIYIGPNFSNVDITTPQLNANTRTGYQAGFFYRAGKIVYGQMGLQYQLMTTNFQIPDSMPEVSGNVSFKRVQLPLYGGFNLVPVASRVLNVRAFGGPIISYDVNIPANDLSMTPDDFARFQVMATAGAGLDVLIFSLDVGYTFGLNNLFKSVLEGKGNYAFVNIGLNF